MDETFDKLLRCKSHPCSAVGPVSWSVLLQPSDGIQVRSRQQITNLQLYFLRLCLVLVLLAVLLVLVVRAEMDLSRDTDGDGLRDHVNDYDDDNDGVLDIHDDDDDGDGVLDTHDEDWHGDL